MVGWCFRTEEESKAVQLQSLGGHKATFTSGARARYVRDLRELSPHWVLAVWAVPSNPKLAFSRQAPADDASTLRACARYCTHFATAANLTVQCQTGPGSAAPVSVCSCGRLQRGNDR